VVVLPVLVAVGPFFVSASPLEDDFTFGLVVCFIYDD